MLRRIRRTFCSQAKLSQAWASSGLSCLLNKPHNGAWAWFIRMTGAINSDKLVIKWRSRASRMALLGCTLSLILKLNNTELLESIWSRKHPSIDVGWNQLAGKDSVMVMLLLHKLPRRMPCQFPKLGAGLGEKVGLFLKKKMSGEGWWPILIHGTVYTSLRCLAMQDLKEQFTFPMLDLIYSSYKTWYEFDDFSMWQYLISC